tara:strand:- start:229 stop:429 length:201 start_codon:yes stop_codon:yes gene_type:complete
MRTVKLKITSTETWYPEVEVPDHVKTDDEILEFIDVYDNIDVDLYDSYAYRDSCKHTGDIEVMGDK